jgi:hypothetical protein
VSKRSFCNTLTRNLRVFARPAGFEPATDRIPPDDKSKLKSPVQSSCGNRSLSFRCPEHSLEAKQPHRVGTQIAYRVLSPVMTVQPPGSNPSGSPPSARGFHPRRVYPGRVHCWSVGTVIHVPSMIGPLLVRLHLPPLASNLSAYSAAGAVVGGVVLEPPPPPPLPVNVSVAELPLQPPEVARKVSEPPEFVLTVYRVERRL